MTYLRVIKRDEQTISPKPCNRSRSNDFMKRRKLESMYKVEVDTTTEPDRNFQWDMWFVYPRRDRTIGPRQTVRIETGLTILAYPYDECSLELKLTDYAARNGLILTNGHLDELYGLGGEADITPVVFNANPMNFDLHRYDELFMLVMRPKLHFALDDTGRFDEIDGYLHFRIPVSESLRHRERSSVLISARLRSQSGTGNVDNSRKQRTSDSNDTSVADEFKVHNNDRNTDAPI